MCASRLELSALAAGGGSGHGGDPRRQAAELLVAQLQAADRAVAEAEAEQRMAVREADKLKLEVEAVKSSAGLTPWGDGLAAQR